MLSLLKVSFPLHQLSSFSYNSCHINKSHKLPFSTSTITSSFPLDVIYSDLWTFPVSSFDGCKYYVIFVDHYTKYIWFYPLSQKSDVQSTFSKFKSLVENYFSTTIKTLLTNGGGKYWAMHSYLVHSRAQ